MFIPFQDLVANPFDIHGMILQVAGIFDSTLGPPINEPNELSTKKNSSLQGTTSP